jgi:hypothetical protein
MAVAARVTAVSSAQSSRVQARDARTVVISMMRLLVPAVARM